MPGPAWPPAPRADQQWPPGGHGGSRWLLTARNPKRLLSLCRTCPSGLQPDGSRMVPRTCCCFTGRPKKREAVLHLDWKMHPGGSRVHLERPGVWQGSDSFAPEGLEPSDPTLTPFITCYWWGCPGQPEGRVPGTEGSVARMARAFIRNLSSMQSRHRGSCRRAEHGPRGHTACAKTQQMMSVTQPTTAQAALHKNEPV